jgi:acetyl-CoA carboxylase biotin carboxyl carrier protein
MSTDMDLQEIQDFVKAIAKSGATEVNIEMKGVKLSVKVPPRGKAAQKTETTIVQQIPVATGMPAMPPMPMPQVQAEPPVPTTEKKAEAKPQNEDDKYVAIKSPMVGTFYKKPSPDKPDFVAVGDSVAVGQTVCILDAMKLFNEIEAEITGKVVKILVEDGTPVEFDQPLFLVDPS